MPSQSPPRVSCFSLPPFGIQAAGTTLNPLFFLGHGATAMMLFNALGDHHLLKLGARYARSTAHSISFFFTGLGTSLQISCLFPPSTASAPLISAKLLISKTTSCSLFTISRLPNWRGSFMLLPVAMAPAQS
jgi:hypothetical protein